MFVHEDIITFVLDGNSDNYQSFDIAVQYFRENFTIVEKKYYPPFWFSGLMDCIVDDISIKLSFDDMFGTDLSISKNLSKAEISKVTQWCDDICKILEQKQEIF
ncbi:MAG: hypothetical protein FWC39_04170 [Bacteroidetes bacterium]|nr:hypothetical protein [Bacteroidota bacterium]